jgi:hypothetical protein
MFCKPGLAIVAVDEAVHGLVSPVNLDLDESSLVTATFLTNEEPFVLISLGLDFLIVPVCPFLPHTVRFKLFSHRLQLFTCNFTHVHIDEILWTHFFSQQEILGLLVVLVLQVVED